MPCVRPTHCPIHFCIQEKEITFAHIFYTSVIVLRNLYGDYTLLVVLPGGIQEFSTLLFSITTPAHNFNLVLHITGMNFNQPTHGALSSGINRQCNRLEHTVPHNSTHHVSPTLSPMWIIRIYMIIIWHYIWSFVHQNLYYFRI
jgi:hypothetical protein